MKIAIGSDHRGFKAKQQIKMLLKQLGHECIDLGTSNSHPVDYPDTAFMAANAVSNKEVDRAILSCGTGIGMCIAANKVKGILAAICHDELSAHIARHHNNANVLCIPGDLIGEVLLRRIVETWLSTEFSGGRHDRRVRKITAIEDGQDPRSIGTNQNH
jgi:ribose 5-phosphate isomerase B